MGQQKSPCALMSLTLIWHFFRHTTKTLLGTSKRPVAVTESFILVEGNGIFGVVEAIPTAGACFDQQVKSVLD